MFSSKSFKCAAWHPIRGTEIIWASISYRRNLMCAVCTRNICSESEYMLNNYHCKR